MQVESWTKEKILEEFSGCENLKQFIAGVEKRYLADGKLVCEVRINGMLLEEDDEVRFAETPLAEIKEASISVSALDDLLNDVRQAFQECIPSLQDTILKCSEYFRIGEQVKAQNSFSAMLEGCQWLVDTIFHVRKATEERENRAFSKENWHQAEKDFSKTLRQVLIHFQSRDYALVSDILEYELTTILDTWLALVQNSEAQGVADVQIERDANSEVNLGEDTLITYDRKKPLQDSVGG